MTHAQVWRNSPFDIERREGKTPATLIFRLSGPFTARDMFGDLTPDDLHKMLEFQSTPTETLPAVNILDLTGVPYMDSTGLGMIISHHVRCRRRGVRLVAVGIGSRVMELFKLTKVDAIIPMAGTVEEADVS